MKSRECGPGEYFWLRMGEKLSNNSVFTYHFEGKFDQDRLKAALEKLVESQEYLRVFYRTKPGSIEMFVKDDFVCPYEFRAISGEEECLALSEHYRNTPFNEQSGRLWLLLHLEYTTDGTTYTKLLCVQNHAIADGESTKLLFEQLLTLYLDPTHELPEIPLRPTFESHFPKVSVLERLRALRSFLTFLSVKKRHEFFSHPPVTYDGGTPRTRDYAFRLSPSQSSALLEKIKKRGAKAHGVFCAAFLKAFYDLYQVNEPRHIAFSNPVNYRNRLSGDFSRDIAYFIVPVNLYASMRPGIPLWEVAEQVNGQVADKTKTAYLKLTTGLLGKMMRKYDSNEKLNGFLSTKSNNFAVISNVGKLPLPEVETDEFRLTDISLVPSAQSFLKPTIAFTIVYIESCLRFELVYSEPFIDREFIEKGAGLIRDHLLTA